MEATNTATASAPTTDTPEYKQWRIRELGDIAEVHEWQMDKVLHFLSHLIRKCRILKRRLVEFTYYEQGRISVVMEDLETGEIYHEPKPVSPDEDDPLA